MWMLVTDLFVKFLEGRKVKGGVTKAFESADQEKLCYVQIYLVNDNANHR